MKFVLLLLVGLFTLVLSSEGEGHYKVADKAFLEKQKRVLQLFNHINQPSHYKEHVEIANSFSFNENAEHYTKPEVVKHFGQYFKYGFLPKGEIFSVFYKEHLAEAVALFKLFYYAKDFDTFYKTAVWARQNVNEGLFLYSFSVAIIHRHDTYGIALPPIYEVYPYYFFSTEVIHEAYRYKQQNAEEHKGHGEGGYSGYTIIANYSGHYLNLHPEQSLSYFTEDVGLNSFYYYYNLYYPFWLSGEEFGLKYDKRGEMYYFIHQQILARYYLERLANDFGEIPFFNWELPIETPYYPSLQYHNGLEFPARPQFARLHEYFYNYGQSWTSKAPYGYSYTLVRDYERRINDAVDSGVAFSEDGKFVDLKTNEGFNILGNLIQSNRDSPNRRFYGSIEIFARHLLGYSYQPLDQHHVAPSALEHYETSLRDPIFYQLYRKIINFFLRQKYYGHPYSKNELTFEGVKIKNVEIDRLVTYFDYFYSDLSNAVYDTPEELEHDSFHVRARQYRLNHRPFSIKATVQSDKDTKASVKVFLGPKYDEYGRYINISENALNFVELEHVVHHFKTGENVVTLNSHDFGFFSADSKSHDDLYRQVSEAYEGHQEYHINRADTYYTLPRRLLLPKGSHDGTPYQFYVFVYPYSPYNGTHSEAGEYSGPRVGTGNVYPDSYPLGYPFDRDIKFDQIYYEIPNSYFYEAKIYHKNVEEINAPHH